jgi:type II secretory pathway component GspD/PulD (secretin)
LSGTIDVLVRFDLFVNHQGSSDYSLAKDRIADLTLMGEFTAALPDSEFEAVLDGTLEVVDNPNIQQVLNQVLSPKNTSMDDMIKVIRSMDHSNNFSYYVSEVFIGW